MSVHLGNKIDMNSNYINTPSAVIVIVGTIMCHRARCVFILETGQT